MLIFHFFSNNKNLGKAAEKKSKQQMMDNLENKFGLWLPLWICSRVGSPYLIFLIFFEIKLMGNFLARQ